MGSLSRTAVFLVLMCVAEGVIQNSKPLHSIRALDCRTPKRIVSWDMESMCRSPGLETTPKDQTDTVTIIQETSTSRMRAGRCARRTSRFVMYCGAYSHVKLSTPPDIMQPEPLSIEDCTTLTSSNTYYLRGKSIHVPWNARRTLKGFERGNVVFGASNTQCEGVDTSIDGERHTNVIIYVTTMIELREVTLIQEGGRVIDADESVTLTAACVSEGSCISGEFTYRLLESPSPCNLREIRTVPMVRVTLPHRTSREEQYWVNQEHKIILRRTGELQVTGCLRLNSVSRTQYKSLHFVLNLPDNHGLEKVPAESVDLELEVKTSEEYLLYRMEQSLYDRFREVGQKICNLNSANLRTLERSPFHKDALIRIRGQICQELSCNEVVVTVSEGERRGPECYDSLIPVNFEGQPLFLDATTLTLVEDGALHAVDCRDQYTAIVRSTAGVYLQAVPEVRTVEVKTSPVHESFLQGRDDHEEEGEDLLYTADEVTAFQDLIHFQRTREQVLDGFVRTYCTKADACGYATTPGSGFDVKNLLEDLVPTLTWWDWLLEKTDKAGQICSILTLLYWCWGLTRKIVRACTDSRRLEIPVATALQINVNLEDRLRNLLYEEARGAPLPPDFLHRPESRPQPARGTEVELRDLVPVQPRALAVESSSP